MYTSLFIYIKWKLNYYILFIWLTVNLHSQDSGRIRLKGVTKWILVSDVEGVLFRNNSIRSVKGIFITKTSSNKGSITIVQNLETLQIKVNWLGCWIKIDYLVKRNNNNRYFIYQISILALALALLLLLLLLLCQLINNYLDINFIQILVGSCYPVKRIKASFFSINLQNSVRI